MATFESEAISLVSRRYEQTKYGISTVHLIFVNEK